MMKAIARIVFCLGLCALLWSCSNEAETGGGDGDGPGSGKPTVTIWWFQWDPAVGLQELGDEFEAETGIAVKVETFPVDTIRERVFTNFANDVTDFDMVVGDSQWVGQGAEDGLYVELTDWLPSVVDMKTLHPKAAKYLCEYPPGSGRYFGAPCETDAVGMLYRKDWFADPKEQEAFKARYGYDLAPPDTWEQFREVAEFFQRPDDKRYGCALLTGRNHDSLTMGFQQIMWAHGGAWRDEKTNQVVGVLNSDGTVQAVEYLRALVDFMPPGAEVASYSEVLEKFKNGTTAMILNYFAFFPGVHREMPDKAGFAMAPGKKGGERVISLGGQALNISAKVSPEQQELAKRFIAWFVQTSVQKKWITKPAGFTANTEILASAEFRERTPYNGPFADSLDHLRDFWNVPVYNELLNKSQRAIGALIDDRDRPIRPVLDKLAADHENLLREAGLLN